METATTGSAQRLFGRNWTGIPGAERYPDAYLEIKLKRIWKKGINFFNMRRANHRTASGMLKSRYRFVHANKMRNFPFCFQNLPASCNV
jgi:hypothetical protein